MLHIRRECHSLAASCADYAVLKENIIELINLVETQIKGSLQTRKRAVAGLIWVKLACLRLRDILSRAGGNNWGEN